MNGALPRSADVVVVGGGVIGAACAYYLARAGARPLLLERGRVGGGTSGSCDGMVFLQSKLPGPHLDLARRSAALYRELEQEVGESIGYRPCGGLQVALSDAARQTLTDHAATLTSAGLPAEVVEGDRLRELEPFLAPDIACGLYSPGDAQVDPWRLVRALTRAARRLGAAIVEKTRVESVRAARGRVQAVVTAQGEVAVPVVVNCLGAWGRELAGAGYEHLPIEPQRGHLLVTEPAPPTVGHVILGADYVSEKYQYGAEQPGGATALGQRAALALALEQTGSGNLLIGSSRELAGHDPSTGVEVLAGVARRACRYLPRLKDLHLLRCFAGLRPHTPHGLPFVGPMPECDGAYIAAGHCGDGICLAPVTGQIVAEMIVSGRPAPGELAATAAGGCRGVERIWGLRLGPGCVTLR